MLFALKEDGGIRNSGSFQGECHSFAACPVQDICTVYTVHVQCALLYKLDNTVHEMNVVDLPLTLCYSTMHDTVLYSDEPL